MKSRDRIMECGFLIGTSIRSIKLVTLYMVVLHNDPAHWALAPSCLWLRGTRHSNRAKSPFLGRFRAHRYLEIRG